MRSSTNLQINYSSWSSACQITNEVTRRRRRLPLSRIKSSFIRIDYNFSMSFLIMARSTNETLTHLRNTIQDSQQLWASFGLCMQKRVDSAFFRVIPCDAAGFVWWLHMSHRKSTFPQLVNDQIISFQNFNKQRCVCDQAVLVRICDWFYEICLTNICFWKKNNWLIENDSTSN